MKQKSVLAISKLQDYSLIKSNSGSHSSKMLKQNDDTQWNEHTPWRKYQSTCMINVFILNKVTIMFSLLKIKTIEPLPRLYINEYIVQKK